MASVYGFRAGCICGVIAQRTLGETIVLEEKASAIDHAIQVALRVAEQRTRPRAIAVPELAGLVANWETSVELPDDEPDEILWGFLEPDP
jgi:hypothetical protein